MMYKFSAKKSMVFKAGFIIFISFILLIFSNESTKGALKGLMFCGEVLVPSLFPFMVISTFVVKCGLSAAIGKYIDPITKLLFGVSGNCGATILLSMIGGYPVGARGIYALYKNKEINENDAVKMSYFAVGAGPGFLVSFLGANLLGSLEIGFCLLEAQIISVIFIGLMNKYIFRKKNKVKDNKKDIYNSNTETKNKPLSFTSAMVEATVDGTYGILEMCGMVVIFSAVLGIINSLTFLPHNLYSYITILFEVTNACNILSRDNNILLIGFAVGFGGLSVHFQIFQALKDIKINQVTFFLFRIIQGLVTCVLTYFLIRIFNLTLPVYSSINSDVKFVLSSSMIGSSLLIITGLCFIYTTKKFKE